MFMIAAPCPDPRLMEPPEGRLAGTIVESRRSVILTTAFLTYCEVSAK